MLTRLYFTPVHRQEDSNTLTVGVNSSEAGSQQSLVSNESSASSLQSNDENIQISSYSATTWQLLKLCKPDWHYIFGGFIFLLAASVTEIFIPYFEGHVINDIVKSTSDTQIRDAIITLGLITFATSVCTGIRGGLFMVAVARMNIRIRNLLFQSVVKQDISFFDQSTTGEITSRLTSDVTKMSDEVTLNINTFLRGIIKVIGTTIFMFVLSFRLTVVTLISLPLIAIIVDYFGEWYKKLSKSVQDSLASANGVAEEVCSSIKTVRSFACESYEIQRYAKKLKITYGHKLKQAILYAGFEFTNEMLDLAITVVTLYYGGHLVITGQISGGMFIAFILYQLEMGESVEDLGEVYTGLMQAVGAADKVFELLDRKSEFTCNGTYAPAQLSGHIQFKDVSFSYPSNRERMVLDKVSFEAKPGEVIALVGQSGSGKSTCISLLERFYEPASGEILIDSHPISEYDHEYLHRKMALVGQEPVLFARKLEENIAYGHENCEFEDIRQSAIEANADEFIQDLHHGYGAYAGERGHNLSGGQKQRIAIARAIVRKPCILLLDEATSALDAYSEHLVQQAIKANCKNRTVIIIAHRLSTVEDADRILVIDKGKVAEEGNHFSLLAKNGIYTKLVKNQLLSTSKDSPQQDELCSDADQKSPTTPSLTTEEI
ncbi:uncharacterized protein TRIADDRAFT_29304 [Trichoplax adhaerens]|uniref:ATP-binding cassette sub-family B member 9 n=1 Tax=Trichoplax adhaerens TaxID=10228 RepID=B3S517_TRIAD|nr:hypothetical protein TRIADDRAFT_29304 [Trichoplax adhaerens]EDV22056.1 hypothetical protein TRIADDRAFT_29304 [Trichoplax adhaerens]|eukprot:XP_002115211.1 hypothetical protein TRIADDRAFT_29304 [Trichoplax adhaerens]